MRPTVVSDVTVVKKLWVRRDESRGDESGRESWVSPNESGGRVQKKVVDDSKRKW